ncbi:MAG: hypothetical protein DRN01_05020, partial [Thermoplasmata archaeon]
MNENMRSKTLAMFVVLAMLLSTLAVIMPAVATIGIDEWEGDTSADNDFVNTSTSELYYGNTVTIEFNGSELNNVNGDIYLYYPEYTYGAVSGYYAYNITWKTWGKILYDPGTGKWTASNVELDYAGLWVVCNVTTGTDPTVQKANMSDMAFYYTIDGWQDIVGWFWVNSTKYYTVT